MKYLRIISDVVDYNVNGDNFILNTKKGLYLNEDLILEYDYYNMGNFLNPESLVYGNLENYTLLNLIEQKEINLDIELSFCWGSLKDNILLVSKNKRRKNNIRVADFYLYDLISKSIKSDLLFTEISVLHFYHSAIISRTFTVINCRNVNDYKQQWQTDLSEYGEITKIIGVVYDRLWLTTNYEPKEDTGIPKYHSIALDIHTGKVAVNFEHKPYSYFSDIHAGFINDKNAIVSLRNTTFYEYDTESLSLVRKLEVPYLKERKIGVKRTTIYGDKIYFTAKTKDIQLRTDILGVLDYHTLEVLWITDVETNNKPQVTDDKLYILNYDNELLIFDRTDIEV